MSTIIISNNLELNIMRELDERLANSVLYIMKGTPPATKTELDALTSVSDRSSDVLVSFTGTQLIRNQSATIELDTTYATPSQSGTATWFWLITNDGDNSGAQACGTIGLIDSGADMTVSSTTVSTNGQYRITDLNFTIPTTW